MTTRYTVNLTMPANAKTRLRATLRLIGGEDIVIKDAPVEPAAPKPRKDNTPTKPESKAIADLFGRRHDTAWSDAEIEAYREASKTGALTLENIALVAEHYRAERKKPDNYCRRDILRFVRNFLGELDKARTAKPKGAGRPLEWADSRPKIVALPDPAEDERIRQAALEHMKTFREGRTA